ncbi:MAG: DNA-binding response regulator [Clostridiales bacterium]|nr:MAG: DNA-binding response regulator [Clostridiales bacterium]
MSKRLLVVDDAPAFLKSLTYGLEKDDYIIDTATDGEDAYNLAKSKQYDMIILDLMLPKIDGLEVCKKIREFSMVPIIILTAKDDDSSKVLGLEYGADDYMTKPYNLLELKARIRAILRRVSIGNEIALNNNTNSETNIITVDDMKLNTLGRKVKVNGIDISLTAKEFDLLLLLAINRGKIYSREKLLEIIWGYEYFGDVRTVDVHIRRLREKIEKDPSKPRYIMTKWGTGYFFEKE